MIELVRIRPFEEGDTARLLAIEKLCPHGNEQCAVGVEKKSGITARYALYDNWHVLVAEADDEAEAGEVGGWIGWLGYSRMRALKSCALTAYKKAEIAEDHYTIERVTIRDIPAVVRLINEYFRDCIL